MPRRRPATREKKPAAMATKPRLPLLHYTIQSYRSVTSERTRSQRCINHHRSLPLRRSGAMGNQGGCETRIAYAKGELQTTSSHSLSAPQFHHPSLWIRRWLQPWPVWLRPCRACQAQARQQIPWTHQCQECREWIWAVVASHQYVLVTTLNIHFSRHP